MGLFGNKDQIICCKCHVSHDKLVKTYQKEMGTGRTFSTPAGNFQIVSVDKKLKLNEMFRCKNCGAYFCKKCGKKLAEKVVQKTHDFHLYCCCPACLKDEREYLEGYN